jgi:hypothetical protein
MHGLVFSDGSSLIMLPDKQFSYAYLKMLNDDFTALGYNTEFLERDGKFVLKIADTFAIIGE